MSQSAVLTEEFCKNGPPRSDVAPACDPSLTKSKLPPFLRKRITKTKICVHNLSGRCNRAENCSFAHSLEELRESPDLYKTRLCTNYMKTPDGCAKGSSCRFAHGEAELRATPDFYKTSLCLLWSTTGRCPSEDKCRWAHGLYELRGKVVDAPPPEGQRQRRRSRTMDPTGFKLLSSYLTADTPEWPALQSIETMASNVSQTTGTTLEEQRTCGSDVAQGIPVMRQESFRSAAESLIKQLSSEWESSSVWGGNFGGEEDDGDVGILTSQLSCPAVLRLDSTHLERAQQLDNKAPTFLSSILWSQLSQPIDTANEF